MKQDRKTWRVAPVLVLLVATLTACTTAPRKGIDTFNRGDGKLSILLMPVDIELSELTAGGVQEPKADWTASAEINVKAAITEIFKEREAALISYTPATSDSETRRSDVQLVKLHSVVGATILMSELLVPLPTKTEKFEWTLGKTVQKLQDKTDADYALFVFMRDSYASAGRGAVIAIGILLGVAIPGGQQVGYASLVDLKSGDIVWFNRLTRGDGDLRTEEAARETVKLLFADLPK